jgi:hypothetical protein
MASSAFGGLICAAISIAVSWQGRSTSDSAMLSTPRILLPLLACALVATAAQAQAPVTPLPNGAIGVQFEFVPFSVAPRANTPQRFWIVPASPALACPMPVLRGDGSADTAMVVRPAPAVPARPMPGANADAGLGCRNPLSLPKTGTAYVW